MGGTDGEPWKLFMQLCGEAFNILRRHGSLFVSLCMLMKDAKIADISGNGDPKFANRQILKLWDRLHMDMSDEEATNHIQLLVMESLRAIMPQLMELAHRIKQQYL